MRWTGALQPGKTTVVATRRPKNVITMQQKQFCKWLAKEKGVSADALMAAMNIVAEGVKLAMARGYRIQWRNFLTLELREMPPRKRWHRLRQEMYDQPAFCRVHLKNADGLNKQVRELARAEVDRAVREIPLSYPGQE